MPTVLVLLADGFEEIEAFTPVDILRRAGIEVTTASLPDNRHVTGRSGITAHADKAVSQLGVDLSDMLLLPGGAGVQALRADPRVRDLVLRHNSAGRWLAAICAAPLVLNDCGLLAARRHTVHSSVVSELPRTLSNERVVTDGNIITSRGAGTALDFSLHLVRLLVSEKKSAEIGKTICV